MREVLEHLLQAIGKLLLLALWVVLRVAYELIAVMERWVKGGIK